MFCGNCTMNAMSTYEKEISTYSNTYTQVHNPNSNNDWERFFEIIRKLIWEDKDYETISMFIFLHNASLKPASPAARSLF